MNTTSSLPAPPSSLPPHPPPPRSRDPTGRPPPIPDMERGRPRRSPSYSRPYPGPGGPGGRSSRSPLPPNPSLRPRSRSRSPPGAHYPPYAGRYRPGPPDGGLPPGMRDTYQPSYPPYPPYPRSRSRSRSPRPYMNHRRSRSRSRSPGFYGHPHGPPYGYRGNGPRRSPSPYHNRIRRNSFSPRRGPGPYSRGDRDRDRDRDRDWDRDRERDRDMDRNRDRDRETDPDKLEGLIRFESWVGWFRNRWPAQAKEEEEAHPNAKLEAQPVVGLPRLYLKYKEGYKMRQLWSLYLVHKNQGWFKDRYSPDTTFVNMRIETTKRGKIPTVNKYLGELKEGVWDEVCYEATREKEGRKLPNGLNLWGPGVPQASDRDVIEITHPPHQLFVKTLHSNQTRESLEATFRLVGGYQYLALSDPSPKKQYARVGWIQFAPTTNMDYALTTLNKVKIGDFQLNMVKNSEPFIGRARYTPSLSCTLDRMRHDATQAKAMAVKLEDDLYLEPVKDAVEEDQDGMDEIKPADTILTQTHRFASDQRGSSIVQEKIEQLKKEMGLDKGEDELSPDQLNESARIELDHWLSYLRNALHTCYYCVAPTDYAEELYRKCIRHLRSSTDLQNENTANGGDVAMEDDSNRAGVPKHGAKRKAHDRNTKADVWAEKRWSDNVDHKIKLIILPRDKIDLEEYGAKQKEDYPPYKRLIESYISIDDPKKCRCTLCNKPFKASEFVARHIVSRHPELINELPNPAEFEERVNKDYPMFNNFALDPQHLPPIMTYPASVDQRMPHMAPDMLPTMHPVRRNDSYRPDDHGRDHPDSARKPNLAHRIGGYISRGPAGLPDLPLGPPPKIKEDPRARRGKVSYVDLDASAGKVKAEPADGGLPW